MTTTDHHPRHRAAGDHLVPARRRPRRRAAAAGRRSRMWRLAVPAVATALAATAFAAVPTQPATAAGASAPIIFGAAGSTVQMIQDNERTAGRQVVGARVYRGWEQPVFGSSQRWARDTGHTLFVSISAGSHRYADIAKARPGSQLHSDMVRQAREITAFGDKVFIIFSHEPEAKPQLGTAAEYAAAWRNVISTYRAAGVKNAEYVWTMTAYGFARKDSRRADHYYPGDAYVDHIAADGYNWYRCRSASGGWRSLASIIDAHRQFGLKHPTKGLMLMEFGSTEDGAVAGRKAAWLADGMALFQQPAYSQYRAVLSWEGRNHAGRLGCGFDFNSSVSAQQAWARWNNHAAYRGTDA